MSFGSSLRTQRNLIARPKIWPPQNTCPLRTLSSLPFCPGSNTRRFDGFDPNSHQKGWHTSWRKLREKAGLPDVEFYQLRHTSITAGGEQNVPLAVMKSLAGHMDAKMSEYYTSIRDNPKVQAVKAIESANPQPLVLLGIEG